MGAVDIIVDSMHLDTNTQRPSGERHSDRVIPADDPALSWALGFESGRKVEFAELEKRFGDQAFAIAREIIENDKIKLASE
jgi:hypothetical protein